MNTNLRMGGTLAATLLAFGQLACTTQESGQGGTGGSGTAGATTIPPGTGGAVGPSTGGTTGSTAGLGKLCPTPAQVLTTFTYDPADASPTTGDPRFGASGSLQGGGSVYPSTLVSNVTGGNWHISGTVGDYSGMGLYFDNCDRVDASQFKGISFTISGSVPANNGQITFGMGTAPDTPTGTWMHDVGGKTTATANDVGQCTPTSGTQYYHPGCTDPSTTITVTATPTPQTVLWSTLTGGAPNASVTPSEITSIYWVIPWSGSGGTPYAVDIVMDDLQFIP